MAAVRERPRVRGLSRTMRHSEAVSGMVAASSVVVSIAGGDPGRKHHRAASIRVVRRGEEGPELLSPCPRPPRGSAWLAAAPAPRDPGPPASKWPRPPVGCASLPRKRTPGEYATSPAR